MISLKNKKIIVTGGSGSLGRHIIKELLKSGATDITSLSRDEGLIKEAKEFIHSSKVTFQVGDINDSVTIKRMFKNADFIYHTAAMKDVIFAERHPREVLKSNILGVLNLLDHAENVKRFINLSSDKAIGVVNCYGASKLFAEYLVEETNKFSTGLFINVRCPNFLGSRGSVIDVWKHQVKTRNEITVTDPEMTRFFVTLPDAARFIVSTSLKTRINADEMFYPFSYTKKFKLGDLAKAFISLFPEQKIKLKIQGKREGEKSHENYVGDVPLVSVGELTDILRSIIV